MRDAAWPVRVIDVHMNGAGMDSQNKVNKIGAEPSRRQFLTKSATACSLAVGLVGAMFTLCAATSKQEKTPMTKILGKCGYRCDLCAARSDDAALRQKMVDLWRKYWGHERYTAENVKCEGCHGERRADMNCKARPCAIEKAIPNCAHCDECPCEDKLKPLLSSPHMNFARFGDVPEEDYNLCMAQFDNIPELITIRRSLK